MPTPPVPVEKIQETYGMYQDLLDEGFSPLGQGGGRSAVEELSKRLGRSSSAIRGHILKAEELGLSCVPTAVETADVGKRKIQPLQTGETLFFWPDTHCPYEDSKAVSVALRMLKDVNPDVVWIMGDMIDFYPISTYKRDPRRLLDLQADIDKTKELLRSIREAAKGAKMYYLDKSNHEMRLQYYLWDKAPALSGLRGLELATLMELDEIGIIPAHSSVVEYGSILVKHGNIVRPKAGFSAAGELDKNIECGVSAHTHRLGSTYRRGYRSTYWWHELGCLCDLKPDWVEGQATDWCHGVGVGWVTADSVSIHPIPIINYKAIWNGKVY